jgi:spermidine synthase
MNEQLSKNLESSSRDLALSCFGAFSCSLVSLGLELVLAKIALINLGSSAVASTITITIYLFGLTLGALMAQNSKQRSLMGQAAATILLVSPGLLLALMSFLGSTNLPNQTILLLLTIALVLPSTSSAALVSLLATRQLTKSHTEQQAKKRTASNFVYLAANLGAFCGALLTGFFILPHFGMSGCLVALALVMTPAAILSWFMTREPLEEVVEEPESQLSQSISKSTYPILFGTALLLTVLECDWLRLSSLLLGSSSQTFATTLAAIIAGLAIGNIVAIHLNKKLRNNSDLKFLPAAALTLSTFACLLSLKSIALLPIIFQNLRIYFQLGQLENSNFILMPQVLATAALVLPTSISLGLIYPIYTSSLSGYQWRKAYTISAAGAIAGPSLFLIILPITSLIIVVKICIVILALFTFAEGLLIVKRLKILSLACLFGSIFALVITSYTPTIEPSRLTTGLAYMPASESAFEQIKHEQNYLDYKFYKDGYNSTISVEESKQANIRILKSDGKVEATIPIARSEPANGSDLGTQTMLCLLPTLIHNGNNLRCLIIGLGSGTTSNTAQRQEKISAVDIVELEPAVIEAAKFFQDKNIRDMARTIESKIITIDARAHLKTSLAYDLIVSQPSEPWVPGSSSLFTVEFFRLMRQRLKGDGLAAQWLQLYGLNKKDFLSALKTFSEVFPDTVIFHQPGAGEILLVGAKTHESLAHIDSDTYKVAFLSSSCRQELAKAGIDSWETFIEGHIAVVSKEKPLTVFLGEEMKGIPLNTDDNMLLEYSNGRFLSNREGASEKQLAENLSILENKRQSNKLSKGSAVDLTNQALDAAIALDPSAYLLLNLKGKRLLQEQRAETAMSYFLQSKDLNPSIEETRELLALALTYLGKEEEGLQETQAAHLLNKQSPIPYLIAACIYQIQGNAAEARTNLNKAQQNCPRNEILNQIEALKFNATGNMKSLLIKLSQAL